MFAADVFVPTGPMAEIEGKIDFIYTGSFLHLFDWARQVTVCKRIVSLLRPRPGSCVFGRQVGNVAAKEAQREGAGYGGTTSKVSKGCGSS